MVFIPRIQAALLAVLVAGLGLGALFGSSGAVAGECPKDQMGVMMKEPHGIKPKGVTDAVQAKINLKKLGLKHDLRLRRLVVKPGGTVPFHSHGERPSIVYIIAGQITEFNSLCGVPIVHRAGQAVAEFGEKLSHWWRNDGDRSVELLSADIFHDQMGESEMME